MSRLTCKDYRNVLDLVYLANRCHDLDGFLNKLFPSIIEVFGAECITLQLIRGCPCEIKVTESRSFKLGSHKFSEDKYYPNLYRESFFRQSPLLREAISSSKNVLKIGDSISVKDWQKSDFLNNFMLPQNLYWELFLTLRWKNNLQGMITIWRSQRQLNYKDNDVTKAEILAPHLVVAINNIQLISRINALERHILEKQVIDNVGLLWLDHKFRPRFSNVKAREICLQLYGSMPENIFNFNEKEFPIPALIVQDCSTLLSLLSSVEPVLLSNDRILSTMTGKKFKIECSLIWKSDQIGSMPNFIVTLSDVTDSEQKTNEELKVRFNLSPRELDVISCLVKGMSNDEIAERLFISKLTVHTHIKNIYRKLGAKSRVELYRNIHLFGSAL